jgi:hypothetical protein
MESMASARKLLGHSTESMTTAYVRARIGEKVSPVMLKDKKRDYGETFHHYLENHPYFMQVSEAWRK